ncbi:hypothetical protein BHM03_00011048 [Ensete ventricosum]|nr:hypothetical protein BHM03_00011048 [Ensete ventricosum]
MAHPNIKLKTGCCFVSSSKKHDKAWYASDGISEQITGPSHHLRNTTGHDVAQSTSTLRYGLTIPRCQHALTSSYDDPLWQRDAAEEEEETNASPAPRSQFRDPIAEDPIAESSSRRAHSLERLSYVDTLAHSDRTKSDELFEQQSSDPSLALCPPSEKRASSLLLAWFPSKGTRTGLRGRELKAVAMHDEQS